MSNFDDNETESTGTDFSGVYMKIKHQTDIKAERFFGYSTYFLSNRQWKIRIKNSLRNYNFHIV